MFLLPLLDYNIPAYINCCPKKTSSAEKIQLPAAAGKIIIVFFPPSALPSFSLWLPKMTFARAGDRYTLSTYTFCHVRQLSLFFRFPFSLSNLKITLLPVRMLLHSCTAESTRQAPFLSTCVHAAAANSFLFSQLS